MDSKTEPGASPVFKLHQEIFKKLNYMKATVTVQSLYELTQVASYSGKKVDLQSKPLVFPMPIYTNVPDIHVPQSEEELQDAINDQAVNGVSSVEVEMSFQEFEQKYLKK